MLDTLAHSDSIFLYTPSQQAIAVMYSLAKERDCTKLLEYVVWRMSALDDAMGNVQKEVELVLERDVSLMPPVLYCF